MRLFGNAIQNYYGQLNITGPAGAQVVNITGVAGSYATEIIGPNTAGSSYGLYVKAGTNGSDNALIVQSAAGAPLLSVAGSGALTVNYGASFGSNISINGNIYASIANSGVSVGGDIIANGLDGGYIQVFAPGYTSAPGQTIIGGGGSNRVIVSNSGAVTINSPSASSQALTINSAASAYGLDVVGTTGAGVSYGLLVTAGTNTSDACVNFFNAGGGSSYFSVRGDGSVSIGGVAQQGAGTINVANGVYSNGSQIYPGIPVNSQVGGSYTTVAADNGRCVLAGNFTYTISNQPGGYVTSIACGAGVTATIAAGSGVSLVFVPSNATGSRTLTGPGICTIYFPVTGLAFISGPGIS